MYMLYVKRHAQSFPYYFSNTAYCVCAFVVGHVGPTSLLCRCFFDVGMEEPQYDVATVPAQTMPTHYLLKFAWGEY